MESLFAALITGGLALIGTIITVKATAKKTDQTLKQEMAVMQTEIKHLRKEVEKHNGFAERVPKLEAGMENLKETVHELKGFHMHA